MDDFNFNPPGVDGREGVGSTSKLAVEMYGVSAKKDAPARDTSFAARYGPDAAQHGFAQVPILMLRHLASSADLRPIHLAILTDLLGYWFYDGPDPFPGQETIATHIGAGKTATKTALLELEDKGLIRRQRRHRHNGHRGSDGYDLEPLVAALHSLAKDRKAAQGSPSPKPESSPGLRAENGQDVEQVFNQTQMYGRERPQGSALSRADLDSDERLEEIRRDLFW